jgi:hypothetical protein
MHLTRLQNDVWGEDPMASARSFGLHLIPDEKHLATFPNT